MDRTELTDGFVSSPESASAGAPPGETPEPAPTTPEPGPDPEPAPPRRDDTDTASAVSPSDSSAPGGLPVGTPGDIPGASPGAGATASAAAAATATATVAATTAAAAGADVAATTGWRRERRVESLPEVHRSIVVPKDAHFWRKMLAFAGPGFLVAVGYMDPGNWATDLAGGAKFGYSLLWVIMMSNLMAILLQHLCIKLGVVTGRDLAQACRDHYSRPTVWFLWVLCELAIAACDLAEVVGSAIGLQLLFGIPLVWGCIITCLDVLAVLYLQNRGFRYIEAIVITLMATIGSCFAAQLLFAKPSLGGIAAGFIPSSGIFHEAEMLYVAIGIIGATVMPHNLYLHSSIVQTRNFERTREGKREAIRFATIDSTAALMFALFINAAILIVAAAAFHWSGHQDVAEIQDAYRLLSPVLGVAMASTLFAIALLASGQNSTLTGTLAGQIVMEGFLNFRIRPWLRRLITRLIAIIPAVAIIGFYGESRTTELLVASQVVLSMQLGFAVWPLMRFTSERAKMGEFVNAPVIRTLGWTIAFIIITLNLKLLFDMFAPDAVQQIVYGLLARA